MAEQSPPPRIARCSWGGEPFRAEEISQQADGNYLMRALEKGPRFEVGSRVLVAPHEIKEWLTPAESSAPTNLGEIRELTAVQAEDPDLWAQNADPAYVQKALRDLTRAIEGDITLADAREAVAPVRK